MRVNRKLLIEELESVSPGLSPKVECLQSNCFIFKDGDLMTFNEEVSCRRPSLIKMTGAVNAAPLLSLLNKLTEDEIDVEQKGSKFVISGKNKRAGVNMENEIESPIDSVDAPGGFEKIAPDFLEAVGLVHQSASEDASQFGLTCLHIHPDFVEACDNWQLTRYKIATGVEEEILVKQKAIKHIVGLGPSMFSVTGSFIHFKRKDGLIISCRKYIEDYPDLSKFLVTKGTPWTIPKGLKAAAEKAEIFSAENANANHLKLEMQTGKLKLKAEGDFGYYLEVKKLSYKGKTLTFKISPTMLKQLVEKHNEVLLSAEKIKVNGGKYEFVAALESPDEKEEDNA